MELNKYLNQERGRQKFLADLLGIAPPLLSQWATGVRSVPIERCLSIEQATGGQVSRRDLRPDDWQKIWPELADKAEAA